MLALIIGILLGLFLASLSLLIIRVKCPKCKKLKPLKEIIVFHWKERKITGQHCQRCQTKSQTIEF